MTSHTFYTHEPDDTVPILNHSRVVATGAIPEQWLYLLHGIYGTGRNWGNVATRLVEKRPEWGVILVDLRLHGQSVDFHPPHTVAAAAADVAALEEALDTPASAILGHSFGGKVALLRAEHQEDHPLEVWIIDSTLRTGEPSGTAWNVLDIVRGLPDRFTSRDEVVDALVAHGYERGVGQWLAMNLERTGEGFRWKLDWDGMEEMLRDYFATEVWQIVENPPAEVELNFVKATQSDSLDDADVQRIREAGDRTGRVELYTIEGGHWLNADNPDAVIDLLVREL